MYLCLMVGQQEVPRGLEIEGEGVEDERRREGVRNEKRRRREVGGGGKKGKKGKKDTTAKEWILKKKDLYRTRGKEGYVHRFATVWMQAYMVAFRGIRSTRLGSGECSSRCVHVVVRRSVVNLLNCTLYYVYNSMT